MHYKGKMMNIIIETTEGETVLFYTNSMDRAKEVCNSANIEYTDMYEAQDEELQYYCISDRVWDNQLSEVA